jgi:hypothetical protein
MTINIAFVSQKGAEGKRPRQLSSLSTAGMSDTHFWDYASANLQNRLISIISSIEPAVALAMRGSATTTAKHFARDMATLIRLRSRMKASPRDPYSP